MIAMMDDRIAMIRMENLVTFNSSEEDAFFRINFLYKSSVKEVATTKICESIHVIVAPKMAHKMKVEKNAGNNVVVIEMKIYSGFMIEPS